MHRIPATIVTGFLGAGKTSLVRHLLSTASGHRLAVIDQRPLEALTYRVGDARPQAEGDEQTA